MWAGVHCPVPQHETCWAPPSRTTHGAFPASSGCPSLSGPQESHWKAWPLSLRWLQASLSPHRCLVALSSVHPWLHPNGQNSFPQKGSRMAGVFFFPTQGSSSIRGISVKEETGISLAQLENSESSLGSGMMSMAGMTAIPGTGEQRDIPGISLPGQHFYRKTTRAQITEKQNTGLPSHT